MTTRCTIDIDLRAGSVRVGGEIDRACAHHLTDAVGTLAMTGCPGWSLDLRDVTFCDVEGLRVLHRAQELARARRGVLRLLHAPPLVTALLPLLEPACRAVLAAERRPVRPVRAAVPSSRRWRP